MDVTRCPRCGGEPIFTVTGMRGALPDFQLQAECDRCGPVEVPSRDVVAPGTDDVDPTGWAEYRPNARTHAFPPMAPEPSSRPRGLRLGDVPGAVRQPRPQRSVAASYLDPAPQSTRPT
jgi:hypothetical protein